MAQEDIDYSIPSEGNGANNGRQVDLNVTYDASNPNPDGSFTITGAAGTYDTLDDSGQVVDADVITGLAPSGTYGFNENELFVVANPNTSQVVDFNGLSFTINNINDSNDGAGDVNFFNSGSASAPAYAEDGGNPNVTSSIEVTCFASGTLIATDRGSVAVEDLSVGDNVITYSGLVRAVRWLGHRTIDCRRHGRPAAAMPVRLRAHAIGRNKPARDLRVSPGHAILLDVLGEILVPAAGLLNGTTVIQEDVDTVTYWHVELDSHDILMAENLPAESYLDMENRGFFSECAVVDLAGVPDTPSKVRRTHADFCRPFVDSGPLLEAVKARLATRSARLVASPKLGAA